MADLSNPLTQVVVAQAQPAVTVNNLVDALSPAAIFGQNDLTTSGLTWGYYGGRYRGIAIAHGTIALPASQASVYIVAAKASGVVSQATSTTNWNDSTNYDRLHLAVTGTSTITDWDDYREVVSSAGAGVATIDTETIQDIVADLITAGTNITKQYNDGDSPPTLVITASGGGVWGSITGTLSSQSDLVNELNNKVPASTFEEHVQDIVGALLTAGSNISLNYNDGDSPPTLSITGVAGAAPLTQEQVEDIVGSLITAGSGINATYNDGDSPATLSIAATGGGLTEEQVQDIVGAMLTAGSNVTLNYNDGDSPATLSIAATGGAGSPGGSDTHVQFNDSSAFGGDAGLVYNKATDTLTGVNSVLTGIFNSAKGADIARAGTTDIWAATGNFVHLTGTTTVTAFGTNTAGQWRLVRFAGAGTLTHNATSLILPGGANITTAANDTALVVGEGSSNARVLFYSRASGVAILGVAGSTTQIQYNLSGALAASSSFTWDNTSRILSVHSGTGSASSIIRTPNQVTAATVGPPLTISTGNGNTTGAGGELTVQSGVGGATDGTGGLLNILAGSGGATNGTGGGMVITAGPGVGSGAGGALDITGGASPTNIGGGVSLKGGPSTGGTGADCVVAGGNGSTTSGAGGGAFVSGGTGRNGGNVNITAASSSADGFDGGSVLIAAGDDASSATAGTIRFLKASTRVATLHTETGFLNLGATTTDPGVMLAVESDVIRLTTAKTPASAGAAGVTGDTCWDANYQYVCVATNTWKRAAHATW